MKEQEIKDLGFEMQHETAENSDADKDWHYYTMDIGTNTNTIPIGI